MTSWLSGVRQGGTRLSATSHRPVDRPRLSRSNRSVRSDRSNRSFQLSKRQLNILQTVVPLEPRFTRERREYGQASRLISTSQLNASLRFHTWPINLVVYQEPSEVLRPGTSHLVEGFTLRCLQRFSLPDVATRRYRWRDNRYTRGPSNPVLSY